jgi:hypothetical protein
MVRKKLAFLTAALLSAAMLWGCGSSGSGGTEIQPRDPADVARVPDSTCLICHNDDAHTTTFNDFHPLVGILADNENAVAIVHSCQDCHGGGSAHRGLGPIPFPRPDVSRCQTCHDDEVFKFLGSNHNRANPDNIAMVQDRGTGGPCQRCHTVEGYVNTLDGFNVPAPGILHTVTCAACHDPLKMTLRENTCAGCHTDLTVAAAATHLGNNPFSNLISERFVASPKGNPAQRTDSSTSGCRACHSHQGAVAYLSIDEKITTFAGMTAAVAEGGAISRIQADLYPDGWAGDESALKRCSTCHDPHSGAARGLGDQTASDLGIAEPGATVTGPADRVVFSAEFNLCTSCHMVNLDVEFVEDAGYAGGGMFVYRLAQVYAEATAREPDGRSNELELDFHAHRADGTPRFSRTISDTHFPGTLSPFFGDLAGEVVGYGVNPGSRNACTSCHDPHSNNKFEVEMARAFAEGIGMSHGNYLANAFSFERADANCTPCHTGREFPKLTIAADLETGLARIGAPRFNALGCVSCHDMAVGPEGDVTQPRNFHPDYEFEFNSGVLIQEALTVDLLGENQLCFECHKGRDPFPRADWQTTARVYDVNYLHYSPSFATLVGAESGMYPLSAGKAYSRGTNRAAHNSDSCLDCHTGIHVAYGTQEVGTPTELNRKANFVPTSLQTDLCAACHYSNDPAIDNGLWRSFNVMRDRTRVFGEVLFETILDEVRTHPGFTEETADTLKTRLTARAAPSEMPTPVLARAGAIWKNFMYDDVGWAHNSLFARQLMYDVLEELGALGRLRPKAEALGVPIGVNPAGGANGTLMRGLTVGETVRDLPPPPL